jgi:hypothetical protein
VPHLQPFIFASYFLDRAPVNAHSGLNLILLPMPPPGYFVQWDLFFCPGWPRTSSILLIFPSRVAEIIVKPLFPAKKKKKNSFYFKL